MEEKKRVMGLKPKVKAASSAAFFPYQSLIIRYIGNRMIVP